MTPLLFANVSATELLRNPNAIPTDLWYCILSYACRKLREALAVRFLARETSDIMVKADGAEDRITRGIEGGQ